MNPHQPQQSWIGYVIYFAIIAVVIGLRLRRMGTVRPLKLETVWVVPAIYLVITILLFIQLPPTGSIAIASMVALVVGAAVGWKRGTMMQIHVNPETHALNQKASPAAMVFLFALIAVKMLGRSVLGAEKVDPAMLTDPLIAFALGMLTLTRVEMYFRGRRLLEEARGGA
jgi:hypothetical protein